MERLLADICQESTKIQDIQSKCTSLMDHLATDDGKQSCYNCTNLEQILRIFQLCVKSEIPKLNALGIDLVRVYLRKVNDTGNESAKEETISIVLRCCREIMSTATGCTTLELSTIIVEIVATFSAFLTIKHVIDIIEMCHQQIKEYVLSVNSRAASSSSLPSKANSILNVNLGLTPRVSIDDKILSAIYLTGGQVCHYYTKHRIIVSGQPATTTTTTTTTSSVSSESGVNSSSKVSQDFVYLLLYLSKKLESKLSFYRDIKPSSSEAGADTPEDQTKSEIFVLIKIYNCFYLKCLQYAFLTIPDAWKYMTTHLMEIVCKHLVPILVDILTPLSTILVHSTNYRQAVGHKGTKVKDLSTFGRGSEKLGSGNSTNKDFQYNTLNYQERQYIYKISLELLRLFGLENSMRPLLEALYHRIFLLPPLDQRLDSLIYMQEILKNPLLVLILMSNPLCLFGASSSHSQNLDLFKIFIDAIKEASVADDIILVQLSSLCLATLFGTLDTLANRSVALVDDLDKSHSYDSPVWKSPTVKTILSFASTHRNQYESAAPGQYPAGGGQSSKHKSSSYSSQALSKYHSLANRSNILNLKSRICGYDLNSFERQCELTQKMQAKQQSEMKESASSDANRATYMREDFNYQDRLRALISSQMSSMDEDSRTVELETRSPKVKVSKPKAKKVNTRPPRRSLHLSLEDLSKCDHHQDWLMASLKYTNSDSRLVVKDPILVLDRRVDRVLSYDSADSVFEPQFSSDSSMVSESKMDDYSTTNERFRLATDSTSRNMFLEHDEDANLRHFERALALIFIRKLRQLLPELIAHRNLVMVDETIQKFASNYCKDLFKNLKQLNRHHSEGHIELNVCSPALGDLTQEEIDTLTQYSHLVDALFINADGIYLATYSALLLNMKLIYLDYYKNSDNKKIKIPLSESGFIDEIFNYHITVYLSSHFLAEIYQNVLADNFFHLLMNADNNRDVHFESIPLINLLHDIEILDLNKPNAFKLSEYVRLEQMGRGNTRNALSEPSPFRPLSVIVKRFLAYFWDTLLGCLRIGLDARFSYQAVVHMLDQVNSSYIRSLCSVLHCENKHTFGQLQSSSAYIQMMQVLLNTSVQVGCFTRLDTLYDLFNQYIAKLSYQVKPGHFISEIKANLTLRKSITSPDLASSASTNERVHLVLSAGQIISMKTLLNRSSEIASHCPKVWRHVFDLCKFVTDMENLMFRSCHSSLLSRARISIGTILRSNSISLANASTNPEQPADHYQNLYSFTSFSTLPGINELENFNIETSFDSLISELRSKNHDLELKSKEMEQVVEYLSWFVGQIFENVAFKFNLSLLSGFVKELCGYSSIQLSQIQPNDDTKSLGGSSSFEPSSNELKSLMLFRLVEVILRFVRNGRPLLHFMKIWPVAAAHLVDASTHRDLSISKKAITSMHDIINAVLSAYNEPDFFNFNESLFKSYERLLLFELCNSDCQQELLLNSICEFVEGASGDIRSGWRSIFKALRGLRLAIREGQLTVNCSHHIQIVVDTFEAFMLTDNMHVFAYASVDFILCIFHLLRGVCSYPSDRPVPNNLDLEETFIIFLKYVQKFCKMLRSIQSMPEDSFVISPLIRVKKMKFIELDRLRESMARIDPSDRSYNLTMLDECELGNSDRLGSLLQLWLLVFDEYATTVHASNLLYRPMLLEVYFTLIQTASELNGTLDFVLHCFNHIILPLIQNLLAETINCPSPLIEEQYMFLKSWLEVFNNYIVKYILSHYDRVSREDDQMAVDDEDKLYPVALLLRQSLLVYIECLNGEYHDLISILALSLIRHMLLSLNRLLTSYFWEIVIDCFRVGHQMTLAPLKQLMCSFTGLPVSTDLTRIKIMTTRTDRASEYTRKRARQIFFVGNSQVPAQGTNGYGKVGELRSPSLDALDNRDYNIIVETCTGLNQSLSYNLLISQLHNHLVLLQIISSVMTFNLKPTLSNLMYFMHEDFNEMCTADQTLSTLRPVLNLTLTQYRDLCAALKQSFCLAMDFDSRPGLKFLMQHICQTNISANLYQMSALVWSVQFVVNFALCCSEQHRNEECLTALEELFSEIGILYELKVSFVAQQQNNSSAGSSGQSDDNSAAGGGGYNGCFRGMKLPFILQPLGSEESMPFEVASDSTAPNKHMAHSNPFNDADTKVYRLIAGDMMAQVLCDYRKMKQRQSSVAHHQQWRMPTSSFEYDRYHSQQQTRPSMMDSTDGGSGCSAPDLGLDHETRRFLQHDSQICVRIWSDILANCIDLHVRSSRDSFTFTLAQFRVLVRDLLLHSSDDTLRQSLSNWVDHISTFVLTHQY